MSGGAAERPPGGPAAAPGIPGPVFVRWFGAFFVLVSIGVFIWGWMVAGGVRRVASETDNAVRTVAWELLRWSAGHDGRFPRSELEFIDGMRFAQEPPAPPPPSKPGGPTPWPADARTALQGKPPALLPEALAQLKVQWPPRPDVAPEILPEGRPTIPGTIEDVRGWLHAWVDAQRERSPVDAPRGGGESAPPPAPTSAFRRSEAPRAARPPTSARLPA